MVGIDLNQRLSLRFRFSQGTDSLVRNRGNRNTTCGHRWPERRPVRATVECCVHAQTHGHGDALRRSLISYAFDSACDTVLELEHPVLDFVEEVGQALDAIAFCLGLGLGQYFFILSSFNLSFIIAIII